MAGWLGLGWEVRRGEEKASKQDRIASSVFCAESPCPCQSWIVAADCKTLDYCVAARRASYCKVTKHGRDQQGCAGHHIRNHFLFPSAGALSSTMPAIPVKKETVKGR
jgi:hypothetical protein